MTPLPPADLSPRRLTPQDLPACLALAEDRGWSREEHKWRLLLSAGEGYGIDAPDQPGGLIGAFVLTRYPGTRGGGPHACVGMLLVAARFDRQGLGLRMMRHALAVAPDTGVFLYATPNGLPLYERLGFKPLALNTMLLGSFTAPPSGPAPAPGVRVRAATAADLPAVLDLDAGALGADRSGLLTRLPAFADRILVAEDRGTGALTGFAASWPAPANTTIGPVVAEDPAVARTLVTELAAEATGPVRLDIDSRNPALEPWARSCGLRDVFTCTLMVHSAPDTPGDPARRFAPYSVALG